MRTSASQNSISSDRFGGLSGLRYAQMYIFFLPGTSIKQALIAAPPYHLQFSGPQPEHKFGL